MNAMTQDITLAYSNIEDANDFIATAMEVNSTEMNLVNNYIYSLEDRLTDLEKTIGSQSLFMTKNYYSDNNLSIIKGEHNTEYGYISCPMKHTSKLDFYHYPIKFLMDNLNIELNVYKDTDRRELIRTESLNTDATLINILNNNSNDCYLTKDILPCSDTNTMVYELTIGLPSSVLSTLAINNIALHPAPLYSLSLEKVEYVDKTGTYKEIKELGNKNTLKNEFFVFNTILSNQLRFTFRQPNYSINNGRKEYVFGIREIFINALSYTANESIWVTQYDLNDVYFDRIVSCNLKTNNSLAYESHQLFLDKDLTKQAEFNKDLTEKAKTIYIKHTIGSYVKNISIISGEEIEFLVTE